MSVVAEAPMPGLQSPRDPAALFVVLEGTDGSGTTTQGDLLARWFEDRGRRVVRTAEPSAGVIGRLLRSSLRGELGHRLDAVTVALLFAADRADHCATVIGPALARGDVVVCDRYVGSSLAFQVVDGEGGIDGAWVLDINREALPADLSILLDVPAETATDRIHRRGKPLERFEASETVARVQARYREVFAQPPAVLGDTAVLDARRSREAVAADVLAAVERVLARSRAQVA